ncbi:hypothetical protein AB0O28_18745 [Microbispora sp. NPDC088329]|uniref:hypothetical protein n=1 Tax=Microbispora sp. NPDC088329 TaxID=3154869 RepID=UPI00343AD136
MATTLVRDLRANLRLGMSDEDFRKGMDGLKRTAPRDGEQIAGAFARSFSRQLGAAFRSLPQAEITADTSEAQIKVNSLRTSLRDLANKRIGIDLDANAAMGEMRAIEAELESLQETADISVRADVSRALAALRSVKNEVDKLGDGREVGGAFAQSFSQRVGQAFRSLPKVEITADSSAAAVKISQLRESLQDLANKRIGIDVDSGPALAQMRTLKSELESLQQTADIDVRADVTRALAELNAVEREVRKIDGETIRIDVDLKGAAAMETATLIQGALSTLEATGPAKLAVVGAAIASLPVVAGAAGGAITAVLGSALAAVGLAASKGSAEAQDALARLKTAAQAEAEQIGQPFERVWVRIVDVAQRELNQLGPVVGRALADLAPDVESFVDDAGSSLEELTPAVDSVQRAFSAMLQSLGPALPGIMRDLGGGISAISDAVADNPETFVRMAQGLAGFVDWAGKATARGIELAKVLQDNSDSVRMFFGAMSLPLAVMNQLGFGMVEVGKGADAMTKGVQTSGQAADAAGQRMAALAEAYGLAGDDSIEAAQKMLDSWSAAFSGFMDMGGALQTIEQRTRASVSGTDRQAQASERLAEVQRRAAEQIQRAQRDVADAHERAVERVQQAQQRVADAHERAAEQVAQAQERVKDAQEQAAEAAGRAQERIADAEQAVSDAVEQAARRSADAMKRVADAQQRVTDAAEDGGRRIADAEQRVADAQESAAERVVDAERRLQDSHARTEDAVKDLTRAREQAAERLEDLQRQTAGIELDEESAQLAIERARLRMQEVTADPKATDLDRREADLAFRQAVQRLQEVRRRNNDLREDLAKAQQAGIEGSAEVVQAKERIAQAQQAEQDAELALAKAREDGAHQVMQAEQALADARQQAARQVAQAEQALSDARADAARQQQDAEAAIARAEADLNRARIDGAKDVQKAKADVAKAEADAAKAARDAARDVTDAEEALRKTKRDSARDVMDAEAALTKARQDAARDVQKANSDVAQSWTSLGGAVKVTTQEYLAELEKQVRAQEQWADNLVKLAGRVPDDMMAELVQMGPKGAEVVSMMTRMTEPELQRFIDLHGRSGKAAGDTFAKNLADAGPILREIARQRGEEVADKVRDGMERGAVSVYDAARKIGLRITQEVGPEHKIRITADANSAYGVLNKLLSDIGAASANVSVGVLKSANGNVILPGGQVMAFAGGVERHVAQIGAPGAIRIWNEPETSGEAYIPLALSKRARSEAILDQVAGMFGGAFVKAAPAGGMPVAGGDGASMGGAMYITVNASFADDRNLYEKGAELAAGLREYVRRGGVMPR